MAMSRAHAITLVRPGANIAILFAPLA